MLRTVRIEDLLALGSCSWRAPSPSSHRAKSMKPSCGCLRVTQRCLRSSRSSTSPTLLQPRQAVEVQVVHANDEQRKPRTRAAVSEARMISAGQIEAWEHHNPESGDNPDNEDDDDQLDPRAWGPRTLADRSGTRGSIACRVASHPRRLPLLR